MSFWNQLTFSSDILVIFHISAARHTLAQKLAMKKKLFSLWKHKMTLLIDLHSWNFCYFSCLAKYLLHTIFLIHNEMLKCNGHDIQCTSFCKKEKVGLFSLFFLQTNDIMNKLFNLEKVVSWTFSTLICGLSHFTIFVVDCWFFYMIFLAW